MTEIIIILSGYEWFDLIGDTGSNFTRRPNRK